MHRKGKGFPLRTVENDFPDEKGPLPQVEDQAGVSYHLCHHGVGGWPYEGHLEATPGELFSEGGTGEVKAIPCCLLFPSCNHEVEASARRHHVGRGCGFFLPILLESDGDFPLGQDPASIGHTPHRPR